jgi:hypothetical protein
MGFRVQPLFDQERPEMIGDVHTNMGISEESFAKMAEQHRVWTVLKTPIAESLLQLDSMDTFTPREKLFFAFQIGLMLNRRIVKENP